MLKYIETDRLICRELLDTDIYGMYTLDSNPSVHIYLGNNPVTDISKSQEYIANIQSQYRQNGIGRWAVIEKASGTFIGWSGLKLITDEINKQSNYHDLGYRFIQDYWGKGYATETAEAFLKYGFKILELKKICAIADVANISSNKVLHKIGMHPINTFQYNGVLHNFYELTKSCWQL
ncbi:GNAT family N-acetyltransferase [Aquimarina sp. W85]|uniref:GNAT family N-acetyltransferase n=1 Tax=Aquimarina rhodophyticola TaxID=3342246 RepID=UPI00366F20C8